MITRRNVVQGGLTLALSGRVVSAPVRSSKRTAIDALVVPPTFNGAIAYARNGRIEHQRHIGMEDVEHRIPVTPATQYKFGSASKWLTSVAVLRLAEQGRLDLDTPIIAYLPGFRHATGERVTLRHLLSNTSGLPDLLSRQIGKEPQLRTSTASAAEIVARFGGGDAIFAPGAGWDYAALNWAIVAAIVEIRTARAFPDVVRRLVFEPLRMTGAGFVQAGQPPLPRLAAAYAAETALVRKMAPVPPFLAASGNVAGTIRDAVRAAHGIFHGPLLRPASQSALRAVRWGAEDYALGGRIHTIGAEPWAWETGKVQGYRTHIAHRLGRSETIVVFNTSDMAQSVLAGWVESIARA